jgi:CubicO group peptidase (beta-lactamase class C family)
MRLSLLATLLLSPATLVAQSAPKELNTFVLKALARFEQPGAAIAVVKDGKVVFQQGWGVRRIGSPGKVDDQTLFQIASNTKAVTAAALAILVDDGKLQWDDPVTTYLPWFRLGGDPYVSREFTVRDLLIHRSGLSLGAGDLLWFHANFTREEIARRLRFIAPTASFRSRYAYDNVLFIVAGEVVKAASGMEWDDFVKARIFTPLGLTRTQTSVRFFQPGDNVAAAHAKIDGRYTVVPWDTVDNIGPGGSINSSVAEWSRWLMVQLDSGKVDNTTRLWKAQRTREMWQPGIAIPIGNPSPAFLPQLANFNSYALGWNVRDYRGRKLVTHTGGLSGMLSRVFLVPEDRLGIVVLTNGESNAFNALGWGVLDYYTGGMKTDWIAAYSQAGEEGAAGDRTFEDSAAAARQRDKGPSLPLEAFTGTYTDAWYGDVSIVNENGHLVLRWSRSPSLTADLEHWQFDTFRARMRVRNAADAFVTFALGYDGRVERMTMLPFYPSTDFSFNYQDLLFTPVR